MDTFYYFLIGGLFLVMLMEISAILTGVEGANMMAWLFLHFWAFVASFVYTIYIFFVENLSSAGYTLLYTFGYIIIEGIISFFLIGFIEWLAPKNKNKK